MNLPPIPLPPLTSNWQEWDIYLRITNMHLTQEMHQQRITADQRMAESQFAIAAASRLASSTLQRSLTTPTPANP